MCRACSRAHGRSACSRSRILREATGSTKRFTLSYADRRTLASMEPKGAVDREELAAAIEARRELGAELEPQVVDSFVSGSSDGWPRGRARSRRKATIPARPSRWRLHRCPPDPEHGDRR